MIKKTFALNDKSVLIILRFLVIIVSSFLALYSFDSVAPESLTPLIVICSLYVLSNIIFIFLDKRYFLRRWFRVSLFMLDIILISLLIYFSQGTDSDMYLVYFLLIFMAGGRNSIGHAFVMTVVVVVVYGALVSLRGGEISLDNTVLLLRVPFFFIVSFIFLYYSDSERRSMEKQVSQMGRLSALGEMLAAVLHEIRNPITVILGYAKLLEDEKDPKTRVQLWEEIVPAAKRTAMLINNIMVFAKQTEAAERSPLDMNTVIENVLALLSEQLKSNKVAVVKKISEGLPAVSGNAQLLTQVFVNIIINARHALVTKPEGEPRQISVRTWSTRKSVAVEISDNGPGIKKEDLDRLFEPFFTTRSEGTGLGLSMSYKIVTEHGGTICAESEFGKGAVFTVELPAL